MTDRYPVILLFGPPGAGKGTQGKILASVPGLHHLATGDMFRSLDPASALGQRVTAFSARGELVPDDLTVELWQAHVRKQIAQGIYDPTRQLLVLDGIPRSAAQAEILDASVEVLRIIHLRAGTIEEMVMRMKRRALQEGRRDDADESVIRRRFEVYGEDTAPVLAHYDEGLVSEISAMGTPIEVLQRILGVLVPLCRERYGNPFVASEGRVV